MLVARNKQVRTTYSHISVTCSQTLSLPVKNTDTSHEFREIAVNNSGASRLRVIRGPRADSGTNDVHQRCCGTRDHRSAVGPCGLRLAAADDPPARRRRRSHQLPRHQDERSRQTGNRSPGAPAQTSQTAATAHTPYRVGTIGSKRVPGDSKAMQIVVDAACWLYVTLLLHVR